MSEACPENLPRQSNAWLPILALAAIFLATPPAAAAEPRENSDTYTATCKRMMGPRAVYSRVLDACVRTGVIVQASAIQEFGSRDLRLAGQRIPTSLGGNGLPYIFYYLDDIKEKTRKPSPGGFVYAKAEMVNVHNPFLRAKVAGLFEGYLRYDDEGHGYFSHTDYDNFSDNWRNNPMLYEAWVQYYGLKIGKQKSAFGFNQLPSVLTSPYSSIITTTAISVTTPLGPNMSITFALEDSGRRALSDGIVSRPAYNRAKVDPVAMFRFATKAGLIHLSAAYHNPTDLTGQTFAGNRAYDGEDVKGWAVSAGYQNVVKWDPSYDFSVGRFSAAVAYAKGAPGYLGIPNYAVDYVVGRTGDVTPTTGWSAVMSYEHILAPKWKLTTSLSGFSVRMASDADAFCPTCQQADHVWQLDVSGGSALIGLEHMLRADIVVGAEAGATVTSARGRYHGVAGARETGYFQHFGVFLRKMF